MSRIGSRRRYRDALRRMHSVGWHTGELDEALRERDAASAMPRALVTTLTVMAGEVTTCGQILKTA